MAQVQNQHIFTTPGEYECTPSSLMNSVPCLKCLSEHQLLAALVAVAAQASDDYNNDVSAIMKDSACFTCLSKKEMLQAFVTMMGSAMVGDEEGAIENIVNNMSCLYCATDTQLLAAFLFLICNFVTFQGEQNNR